MRFVTTSVYFTALRLLFNLFVWLKHAGTSSLFFYFYYFFFFFFFGAIWFETSLSNSPMVCSPGEGKLFAFLIGDMASVPHWACPAHGYNNKVLNYICFHTC